LINSPITKPPNHHQTNRPVAIAPKRWHSTCFRVGFGMFLWLELHAFVQDARTLKKGETEATCEAIVYVYQLQSWYLD
jgi:hypothetical protein